MAEKARRPENSSTRSTAVQMNGVVLCTLAVGCMRQMPATRPASLPQCLPWWPPTECSTAHRGLEAHEVEEVDGVLGHCNATHGRL